MKTKEELEQIKEEYTELNKKLANLSEDELVQVVGGYVPYVVGPEFNCASNIEYQRQKNKQHKSE